MIFYNSTFLPNIFCRLSKFDISEYEPPDGNEIEKRGLWPPTVLVEPLEIGTAILRASLLFHGITVSNNVLKEFHKLIDY